MFTALAGVGEPSSVSWDGIVFKQLLRSKSENESFQVQSYIDKKSCLIQAIILISFDKQTMLCFCLVSLKC